MANKDEWDFECPQFIDFEAQLDNSSKDDIFFDCKDESSSKTPATRTKGKHLTESDENKLLDKMTSALSLLENTPKVTKKAIKGKLLSEKFSKDLSFKVAKSTVNLQPMAVASTGFYRSKTIARLNKIVTGKTNKCGLRRSSSLNDIRICKKLKYPITPMCLKRTIIKSKQKVIKTSEEMELEEIAKLQKQLIQHLRQNEMTLKKLKLKPRSCATSKTQTISDKLKENKGLDTHNAGKSDVVEKESRQDYMLNPLAVRKVASRLDNIIHNKTISTNAIHNDSSYGKSKRTSTSFSIEVNEKNKIQGAKKYAHSKMSSHSGLVFIASVKNNISEKYFSIESKIKETKYHGGDAKQKEISTLHHKVYAGKENVHYTKPCSTVKKLKEAKYDAGKLQETNKTIKKRAANTVRGVPLSEIN